MRVLLTLVLRGCWKHNNDNGDGRISRAPFRVKHAQLR